MSRMKMDDIIFGRSLREPGYRVDFAVGSTYSLDIETFISLPFSLGFLEEPDEAMKKSLTYIFAALRLCSDRLAVFCNFADIKVPPTAYKVYCALMEGSVFPVDVSRKNRIVNFHPKVWVVRQTSIEKDDSILRVIVMSRNLTRDGSLDCACVLTGRIGDQQASEHARAKHKPLRDFLRFLAKNATGLKQADMIALAADVLRVERFDVDGPYDDYAFLPMGIRGYSGEADLDDLRRSVRVVVVSPFLDDETAFEGIAIDQLHLTKQDVKFIAGEQADAFEHGDMRHGAKHVVGGEIEVHLAVATDSVAFDILIDLDGFFPKFHSKVQLIGNLGEHLGKLVGDAIELLANHRLEEEWDIDINGDAATCLVGRLGEELNPESNVNGALVGLELDALHGFLTIDVPLTLKRAVSRVNDRSLRVILPPPCSAIFALRASFISGDMLSFMV